MKFWNFISNLGCDEQLEFEEIRRIRLLNRLNFLTAMVLLTYVFIEIFIQITVLLPGLLIMIGLAILTAVFIYFRKFRFAKNFAVIVISWCISFFVLSTGDGASETMFIPLAVMPLIIFKNKHVSVFYLIYLLSLLIGLKLLQPHVPPLLQLEQKQMIFFRVINIATSLLVTYFITYYFKGENEGYERKLVGMHELVTEKNKEITDSIRYAKHIQNAILPEAELFDHHFKGSFIFYRPKDIVAGDFYWLFAQGEKVYAAAADCTGHGVPGAMVSLVCYTALNRAVKELGKAEPAEILEATRAMVIETFEKQTTGSADQHSLKDGMDISLICYNKLTNELSWAGANNPLWILEPGAASIHEIKGDKQPVGKNAVDQAFTNHRLTPAPGSLLLLFTDGFADQFGGEKGKKYKQVQLKEFFARPENQSLETAEIKLQEELDRWKGDLEQVDDILVLGLRC